MHALNSTKTNVIQNILYNVNSVTVLTFELYLYCFTQFSGSHKELGSRSNGLVWKDAYSDFTQPWYFIQSIWVSKLKSKQSVCLSNAYQMLENCILKTINCNRGSIIQITYLCMRSSYLKSFCNILQCTIGVSFARCAIL